MTRYQAAATHLLISLGLMLLMLAVIFFSWYPAESFALEGGIRGLLLLVSVDLVLGPLLTLIVFKAGKKGLKFDLSLIALFQLSAMIYGLHSLYIARPVMAVIYQQEIHFLTQEQVETAQVQPENFTQDARLGLPLAWLPLPETFEQRRQFRQKATSQGKSPVFVFGSQYQTLPAANYPDQPGMAIDTLDLSEEEQQLWQEFSQQQSAEALQNFRIYPLRGRFKQILAIFDLKTQTIHSVINIKAPDIL